MDAARYGIRRPYLLRVASLAVLMIGLTTKFSSAGTLPSMTPISVPEAPKDLYWSGSRVGTRTYSMISYQNAPQSNQKETLMTPNAEYCSVPAE